ncbi:rod shape-determining protein MreD [Alkalihalobacillus hwajinpoensis]|uniref:rod shape-determining protein MreD n=1 Tax=Guptibacillus hwajinpoensis TaxID=208199 RepID=UPI0018848B85|nr:rod shape-determining protein MreD [Pseudalkalibacillus hwajinpoensis]MBF0706376.1 rod shape-determining protein MreD [Pseudalkalibacillus hwajinpoensis]
MRRFLLIGTLFVLFLLEGTVFQVFAPEQFGFEFQLIPRFVTVIVIMIGMILTPAYGVVYGVIFGLLHDLIYTDLVGVYMFGMSVAAYIIGYLSKVFHLNWFTTLILGLLGVSLVEFYVYELFSLINVTDLSFSSFFYKRYLPSLLLNGIFLLIVYYPVKRLLDDLSENRRQENQAKRRSFL